MSALASSLPTIKRRLVCLVYESLLIFSILFTLSFILSIAINQRDGLTHRTLQQFVLIISSLVYCIGFWCKGGQTLAMKTWKLKVVTENNSPLNLYRACLRYFFALGWIGPGLLISFLLHLQQTEILLAVFLNILTWASSALWLPERQFLHDYLAKTRIKQIG